MQRVYLETTTIGHITGRMHPDPIISARQLVTRRWWDTAGIRYKLLASELVVDECSSGDFDAAKERLALLSDIVLLELDVDAKALAAALLQQHAVPETEPRDAMHIAVAAVNGIDYLATWNFRHIMNPATQHLIDAVCRRSGYEPATICTPEQLLETYDDS